MSNAEKAGKYLLGHIVVQATSEECVCGVIEFAPSQGRQKHVLRCVESGCGHPYTHSCRDCVRMRSFERLTSFFDKLWACRAVLQELPSRASGSTKGGIIASLYNLHRSGRCFVQGAILCCSSGPSFRSRARLDLFIKQDAITGGLQWERNRSTGDLFSIMIPATDDTLQNSSHCPVCGNGSEQNCTAQITKCFVCSMESQYHERESSRQVAASHRNDEDEQHWHISSDAIQDRVRDSLLAPVSTENSSPVFKLHSCFEELPNWLVVTSEYPPLPPSMPGQQSALQTVPQEAMHSIACLADDTSALACTCRYLRAICSEVASGLLPTLHPHQRAALKRMAERERVPQPVPHCHIRRLPLLPLSHLHVYVDCVMGDLLLRAPSEHLDIRGGLFCDDPGLGKTVTALALITNSLGKVPEPSKGSQERSGSFQDSFREVSGSFYMAPLSELLEEAGIDEVQGPNTALGNSSSTATVVSRGGSQPGEGEMGTPKKRRASSRFRRSIVVMPNNRKARDAAQQGIKRPARNLKVLEDLKLAPNSASTSGEQTMKKQISTKISDIIASVGTGFSTEVDGFVGELPQNIRYFTDLILSFCHEHDVTPDALHSLPAVRVLLGRLQSQHRTFSQAAHAAIRRGMGQHSFASQAAHTEGAPQGEGADNDAYENDLAQASAAYVQCCASHMLRVPLVKYRLTEWAHTLLPTATQRTFTQNTGKGKPVSMNEAAAQAGIIYTQKLLSSLGLIPAEKAESQTHNSTKKRSLDDEDYDGDYVAPSPSKKSPKQASTSMRQKSAEEASRTPVEGSGAAESSGGSASLSYMFPEHVQSNQSLRFDAPALSRAFKEASIEHKRNADLEPVMLSPATLVVVPAILVEHWKHEIAKHVKHALLRVYCIEDAQSADIPAHELAWDYDVVLTTFTHLSAYGATWQLRSREARHVVLQVRWLRVILDEGHILGRSVQTNRMALLRALRAERRWVMTGTPTPQSGHKHVAALAPLLEFLHCAPFHGSSARLWEDAVCAPFEAGCVVGKQRLMDVLGRIMIRSSKAGVTESRLLPPCTKSVVRLPFDPQHQVSYNALVEIVLRNLLLADWFDEGHVESILNHKRSKFAAELLSNMRLACSVAGQCNLEPNIEDVLETLQILAKSHQMPVPEGSAMIDLHVPYQHPLSRVELSLRNGGLCDACNADTRMPLVTPCAHLLCVDCTALSSEACCVCGAKYEQQAVDAPDRCDCCKTWQTVGLGAGYL